MTTLCFRKISVNLREVEGRIFPRNDRFRLKADVQTGALTVSSVPIADGRGNPLDRRIAAVAVGGRQPSKSLSRTPCCRWGASAALPPAAATKVKPTSPVIMTAARGPCLPTGEASSESDPTTAPRRLYGALPTLSGQPAGGSKLLRAVTCLRVSGSRSPAGSPCGRRTLKSGGCGGTRAGADIDVSALVREQCLSADTNTAGIRV